MFRMWQKITIDGKVLPFVGEVEITSSRNNFTDTAVITVPNRISARGNRFSDLIPQGASIKIELGYYPILVTEFEGYVSQVMPDRVCTIYCEDEAYQAKRKSVGVDVIQKATTVKDLVGACYGGDFVAIDANIGDWKVSKAATIMDVLKDFQDKFKIFSYFRGSMLIVGAQADTHEPQSVVCNFQKNVPLGQSSFSFKEAEADRVVVKTSAINRAGEITEVYAYYVNQDVEFNATCPEVGTVNEFNINGQSDVSLEDLKTLTEIRLRALSYTGAEGEIMIFGTPSATHGDYANVIDAKVPEKEGKYSIVEVTKQFGKEGYRQILGLGIDYDD